VARKVLKVSILCSRIDEAAQCEYQQCEYQLAQLTRYALYCATMQAAPSSNLSTKPVPEEPVPEGNASTFLHYALLLIFAALCLLRSPISQSLWLDESISLWLTRHSWLELWPVAAQYQGQSPLYFYLLKAYGYLFGESEQALRSLSFLLVVAATLVLRKVLARYFSSTLATLGALAFLAHDGVLRVAFSARPYAFGLFCIVASLWTLQRLMAAQASKRMLFAHSVLCALIGYAQYLFLPVLGLHWALAFTQQKPVWRRLLVTHLCAALLLLPALPHFLSLQAHFSDWSFAKQPVFLDLAKALLPAPLLVYFVCALSCALLMHGFNKPSRASLQLALVALVFCVLGPLLLYLHAQVSSSSLWVDRLYLWQAPIAGILLAAIAAAWLPQKAYKLCLGVFLAMASYREIGRIWYIEDWRSAIQRLEQQQTLQGPATRLLFFSGLIEAEQLATSEASVLTPQRRSYLSLPLSVYAAPALGQQALLLPSNFDEPAAQHYFEREIEPQLQGVNELRLLALRIRRFPRARESYAALPAILKQLEKSGFMPESESAGATPPPLVQLLRLSRKPLINEQNRTPSGN
jgi:uncharacterized membrane protein